MQEKVRLQLFAVIFVLIYVMTLSVRDWIINVITHPVLVRLIIAAVYTFTTAVYLQAVQVAGYQSVLFWMAVIYGAAILVAAAFLLVGVVVLLVLLVIEFKRCCWILEELDRGVRLYFEGRRAA